MPAANDAGVRLAALAPAVTVWASETTALNSRAMPPLRRSRLAAEDTEQPSAYSPSKFEMLSEYPKPASYIAATVGV